MERRVNKPKAFLSHSKVDKAFIEKLANDLRSCQIDTWLDTDEIRDGKPWLKVIFEEGIPTCDVVIVYFTENSLQSKMVAKEIDAALIEELSENGISFLPYVNNAALRNKLRVDIRSLQCREWNEQNYNELLPKIVAEIWRSYMERIIKTATLQEKNRRLELELKLKELEEKNQNTIFTISEDKDFTYILSKLNVYIGLTLDVRRKSEDEKQFIIIGKDFYNISFIYLLLHLVSCGYAYFSWRHLNILIPKLLEKMNLRKGNEEPNYANAVLDSKSIALDITSYGLTSKIAYDKTNTTRVSSSISVEYREEFTSKFARFRYWLEYNNHSTKEVEYIGFKELDS